MPRITAESGRPKFITRAQVQHLLRFWELDGRPIKSFHRPPLIVDFDIVEITFVDGDVENYIVEEGEGLNVHPDVEVR